MIQPAQLFSWIKKFEQNLIIFRCVSRPFLLSYKRIVARRMASYSVAFQMNYTIRHVNFFPSLSHAHIFDMKQQSMWEKKKTSFHVSYGRGCPSPALSFACAYVSVHTDIVMKWLISVANICRIQQWLSRFLGTIIAPVRTRTGTHIQFRMQCFPFNSILSQLLCPGKMFDAIPIHNTIKLELHLRSVKLIRFCFCSPSGLFRTPNMWNEWHKRQRTMTTVHTTMTIMVLLNLIHLTAGRNTSTMMMTTTTSETVLPPLGIMENTHAHTLTHDASKEIW